MIYPSRGGVLTFGFQEPAAIVEDLVSGEEERRDERSLCSIHMLKTLRSVFSDPARGRLAYKKSAKQGDIDHGR